jgi:hypothetical protein
VTERVPGVQKVYGKVTAPALSVPVPSVAEFVVSVNVTVPVAAVGVTAATRATLSPVVSVPVVEDVSVVVVAVRFVEAVTVTETALDVLPALSESPPYLAVIDSVPAVENVVDRVAVPELRVPVPSEAEPL